MQGHIQPFVINEETKLATQPAFISTKLKQHQLAMIHEMQSLEEPSRKRLKLENNPDDDEEFSFETKFGCVCDKVGSGKSLTILGLIASKPKLSPSRIVANNYYSLVSIYSERKTFLPINVLVVPHGIIPQWTNYLDKDTTLNYVVIKNNKQLISIIEDINIYKQEPEGNEGLIDFELYLVSSTFYNKFAVYFHNTIISRLIVDEVDSINVKGAAKIPAEFTWFISSSKSILEKPGGEYKFEPYTYTGWNGQVYQGQRRYIVNKITHTGYFRNVLESISKNPITNRIYLKSDDEFVEKSFSLPEYTTRIIKCKNTLNHNVLHGLVDQNIMDMINAGDIKGAMTHMGCQIENPKSIIDLVTKKLEKFLRDRKAEFQYKSGLTYTNEAAKKQALDNVQKQIDETEKKIDCIKTRIFENNTCPICADEITARVIVSCCNNPFCLECITMSLAHKPSCPLCRKAIGTEHIIAIDEDCEHKKPKEEEELTDEDREKIDNFKKYFMERYESGDKKILIFSKYEASFKDIKDFLDEKDITYSELKGVSGRVRNIVEKYKSSGDNRLDVLLLNAKHFGSGLNLENTTDIFMYHNMGGPLTNQVVGRAQRPGRTGPLTITRLCYDNEI